MLTNIYSPKTIQRFIPFIYLSIAWLAVSLISSMIDIFWDGAYSLNSANASIVFSGLLSELFFFFKIWIVLFAAYFLVVRFAVQIPLNIFTSLIITLTVVNLLLVIYYKKSLMLLGADFFNYNWQEIKQTAGASGSLNLLTILLILMPIISIPVLYYCLKNSKAVGQRFVILFFVIAGTTLVSSIIVKTGSDKTSTIIPVNKLEYFVVNCFSSIFKSAPDIDIYAPEYMEAEMNDEAVSATLNYTREDEYPFLHQAIENDVLSPFLANSDSKPDIVLIIVEGLGRAYHNTDAYLGSFTPFLDSLSAESLYWENFLSSGGRTFAALPSILGSLPFGQSGFLSIGKPVPGHLSLVNVLKQSGYRTSFFYGGDSRFDNMDLYLRSQSIDAIVDQSGFSKEFEKLPLQNGFTWGYGDHELYAQYLKTKKQVQASTPTLDILLTVAMHSPFRVEHQQVYEKLVRNRIDSLDLNSTQREFNLQYVQQLSTVMYSDNSLRILFEKMRSDPRYQNSIFIITGDHRMPEIPMSTKIDRYHVPLIIYSPNLIRTAKFSSVSSHFDIAPSLLSLLKNSHGVELPDQVSWIGTGLDTARYFRNIQHIPLMQSKGSPIEYVSGNYHLCGENIFQLPGSLKEEPVSDELRKRLLQQKRVRFLQKNEHFSKTLKLYPDSLLITDAR